VHTYTWTKTDFGPICVRNGPKILRIYIAILSMIVSNRSKSHAKEFKSCIKNMSRAFSYKNDFISNLWFETYHLTGRFIRDQLQPVSFIFDRLQILVRFMSYVLYQIPISRGVQNIFPQRRWQNLPVVPGHQPTPTCTLCFLSKRLYFRPKIQTCGAKNSNI